MERLLFREWFRYLEYSFHIWKITMYLKHTEIFWNRLFQCFSIHTYIEKAYFSRFQYVSAQSTFSNASFRVALNSKEISKVEASEQPRIQRPQAVFSSSDAAMIEKEMSQRSCILLLSFNAVSLSDKGSREWRLQISHLVLLLSSTASQLIHILKSETWSSSPPFQCSIHVEQGPQCRGL